MTIQLFKIMIDKCCVVRMIIIFFDLEKKIMIGIDTEEINGG
jgi:hypothetical protein